MTLRCKQPLQHRHGSDFRNATPRVRAGDEGQGENELAIPEFISTSNADALTLTPAPLPALRAKTALPSSPSPASTTLP